MSKHLFEFDIVALYNVQNIIEIITYRIIAYSRKGSWRKSIPHTTVTPRSGAPQIRVDSTSTLDEGEDGYVSDSSSTTDNTEDDLDEDRIALHVNPGQSWSLFSTV